MIPAQAFIYLLITFGVIFFFHNLKEWKKFGSPPASILPASNIRWLILSSLALWIAVIGIAILYREGLEGSPLHLISYLGAAVLGNIGLLLKMLVRKKVK